MESRRRKYMDLVDKKICPQCKEKSDYKIYCKKCSKKRSEYYFKRK